MNLKLHDWLGQVTTGHGAMVLGPTLLAVAGGQMDWTSATPLLVAGVIGLLWPENTALKTAGQNATTDIEALVTAYRTGLQHGAVVPAAAPAPAAVPVPAEGSGSIAKLAAVGLLLFAGCGIAACSLSSQQQASLVSAGVTLASAAASQNKTAAQLVADGALICAQLNTTTGQIVAGTLVAVANSAGAPVSVTNQIAADVAAACPAGTTPTALPATTAATSVPVVTTPTTLPPAT